MRPGQRVMQHPIAGNGGDGKINPLESVNKYAPFFGDLPVEGAPFYNGHTPLWYTNFKCTFMRDTIDETFQNNLKNAWFPLYFPKINKPDKTKLQMKVRMKMQLFTPDKIKGGAPTGFTTMTYAQWFDKTERIGVGLELDWEFVDDPEGLEVYAWWLAAMAASIEHQYRIDVYRRLNEVPDMYARWVHNNNSIETALEMIVEANRSQFNTLHRDKWQAMGKLDVKVSERERLARLHASTDWILDESVNWALIFNPLNSQNKYVGQYKKNGNDGINHLESMADVISIGQNHPVALQTEIPLDGDSYYYPLRSTYHIGHYYTLPNLMHEKPADYEHKWRSIGLHDGLTDKVVYLSYPRLAFRAVNLLGDEGFKKLFPKAPYVKGCPYLYGSDAIPSTDTREAIRRNCVQIFHEKIRAFTNFSKQKEDEIYTELSYDKITVTQSQLNKMLADNWTQIKQGKLNKYNFYKVDFLGESFSYLMGRSHLAVTSISQPRPAHSHILYLEKAFTACKTICKMPLLPDSLTFKTSPGNMALTMPLVVTDKKDWGMVFELLFNMKNQSLVSVHPSLKFVSTGTSIQLLLETGAVVMNPDKYLPTLIPWDNMFEALVSPGTDVIRYFYPITVAAPDPDIIADFTNDPKLSYYDKYYDYLFAHIDIGEKGEKIPDVLKMNIDLGFQINISVPNETVTATHGYRLQAGKSMFFAELPGEVFINSNTQTRRFTIQFEKETAVQLEDPWSIFRVQGISVVGRVYGDVICDDPEGHSFHENFESLQDTARKTLDEYKDEKSVYVFFVDPCAKTGTGIQILTSNKEVSKFWLPDKLGLYTDKMAKVFEGKNYHNQIADSAEIARDELQPYRNLLQCPGPCMVWDVANKKYMLNTGNGWWNDCDNDINKKRFGDLSILGN